MKASNRNLEVEELKKAIWSDDWETAIASSERLAEIGGDDVLAFLIGLLDSEDSMVRHMASLALSELADNRAIEPLLKSIFKPENCNSNGTMVYALLTHDCKDILVDLFKILFWYNFEPCNLAYIILNEQIFEFTRDDLFEIKRMWIECSKNPEKYPGFKSERMKLMIQDAYEGYIAYLEAEDE